MVIKRQENTGICKTVVFVEFNVQCTVLYILDRFIIGIATELHRGAMKSHNVLEEHRIEFIAGKNSDR